MLWMKIAQQKQEDAKIQNLVPFVEENGIVRANGRLGKCELLTYD